MVTLPKLDHVIDIVNDTKKPSQTFQRWWQKVAETLQTALAAIEANVAEIQDLLGIVNTKNRVFRQTSAPTADVDGDLWIDTDDGNKMYRWNAAGPAWVAVQDEGAEYARLGLNSDGTVATDKVVNDSIAAGAVIATPTLNNSSSTNIASGSYTWTDCDDITFTATGRDVILMCDFNVEIIDNCKYMYRLRYSGATLGREVGPITANTSDQPPGTIVRVFTPSAGSCTVTLQAACNDAGDITVHDPVFVVMENRNV
jgi:hypothetical protein